MAVTTQVFQKIGTQSKDPELKSCSLNTIKRLRTKYKQGFVVFVSQRGCAPCAPAKASLKKAVGGKIPIVEIPAEDAGCDPLLDKWKVDESPSVLYIRGRKVKRISNGDVTNEDIAKQLMAIVGAKK